MTTGTLRLIAAVFSWFVFSATVFSLPPQDFTKGKYKDRLLGMKYVTFSGGAGIWYKSLHNGLDNHRLPFSVFAEFGRTSLPISFITGTTFRTVFSLERFLIKEDNLIAGVQYTPFAGKIAGGRINIYCIAGAGLSYTRFTENIYPGIVNYEYKEEKNFSLVPAAGLGAGYRFGKWELKPVMLYSGGNADFLAGHFTPQRFNTGSLQLHLLISHRFILSKNNMACPVYRKFIGL